jgi:hypothetical protein
MHYALMSYIYYVTTSYMSHIYYVITSYMYFNIYYMS